MADPKLKSAYSNLQGVERLLLEIIARANLTNAPSVTVPLGVLTGITQPLVQAVMDLEALQQQP